MAKQKLFTKSIDDMLFAQYKFGSDFDKQKVVCKIFNPYGDGTWYILNSDPEDPDYMWAIVKMFGNVEVGSVSRSELQAISFFGLNLGLERDISFTPTNAKQVYEGLLKGEHFAKGGKFKNIIYDLIEVFKRETKYSSDRYPTTRYAFNIDTPSASSVWFRTKYFGDWKENIQVGYEYPDDFFRIYQGDKIHKTDSVLVLSDMLKKLNSEKVSKYGEYLSNEYSDDLSLSNSLVDVEWLNVKKNQNNHAKGGKIGFKGLADKVAARYKGKSVPAKYKSEYGKTYDAAEAKEVGNKVAAKVYRQQLAKKKFALGGNTSDQPKIYVEELIAHKEGLDDGEWIILTDYNDGDEIMDAINDLLEEWSEKYGEERDEYIVSAYENFDEEYYDKFMDETQFDEILEKFNKGGNLEEISEEKDIPVDVLEQIVADFDPDDLREWIDDNYYGYFNSERELAEEYVQSIGGLSELSTNTLEYHFDYDGFGSDLASDYSEYDGYYFRNYKRGGVMPKHNLSKYVKKKGKFALGGQTEFIDLFEDYESQPPKLRRIIEKYEKKYMDGDMDYAETAKMQAEVVKIGYVFDSGLDNEVFGLRPIGVKLGQLKGYEGETSDNDVKTIFDEFAKGGYMAFGGLVDEFPIENVNRADLNYILYMLEGNDISFDLDGVNEVLSFDMSELNERQQKEVSDILMIGETYQPSRATDTNNFAKGGLYRKRRAYRQKQDDRLVYFVREDKVQAFLKRYPKVEETMTDYANRYKSMNRAYANWLRWMNNNEAELGGRAETLSAPSFGVKTFYKYDWNGVDGWAEIMQYIYTENK
jgi:hypothetical protein